MKKIILPLSLLLLTFNSFSQETTAVASPTKQKNLNAKRSIYDLPNEKLLPSSTLEFNATAITTNFTIPLLRFNRLNAATRALEDRIGNVSFFNSVGAGVCLSIGTLKVVTDAESRIIDREMINTIGLQLGFLFSSNTSQGTSQNVFAPTLSLSLLNLQLGVGYELGKRGLNEEKAFLTVAYGIPIAKLIRGGFFVFQRSPSPIKNNASGFLNQ